MEITIRFSLGGRLRMWALCLGGMRGSDTTLMAEGKLKTSRPPFCFKRPTNYAN